MRAATTGVVRRALLVLALVAAPAVASARPAHARRAPAVRVADGPAAPATTDAALGRIRALAQRRADLARGQAELTARQQGQLAEVDRLKRQRASWRRDRQLKDALAVSLDTARQLGAAARQLAEVDARLAAARRAALAAIDAELAAAPAPRRRTLAAIRATLIAQVAPPAAKRIVLPDDQLDPLADPEELDQQAAALRQGEAELAREADSLARQAARWQHQADLRRQHERARDLALRDDDQPRRTSGAAGAGGTDGLGNPSQPTPQTGGGEPGAGGFEGQPEIVLADVIDPTAVDALRAAEQSTDPAAKATAAAAARDQVEARLARLRQHRAAIEARARELRARGP